VQEVNSLNIRTELRNWACAVDWDVSATLTFADDLTPEKAHDTVKRFWNRVDCELYGNAARRYNKRCERLLFLEGSEHGARYHYHAAVKMPSDRFNDTEEFCQFLRKQWRCECAHNHIVEFKPTTAAKGWVGYITKSVEKGNCDTFDVAASHIAVTNLLNEQA
jgi:hypothetical protein